MNIARASILAVLALAAIAAAGCGKALPTGATHDGDGDGHADAGTGDVTLPQCSLLGARPDAGCGEEKLPCYRFPEPFQCQPEICACENGNIRCVPPHPGTFGGTRECQPDWSCVPEGFPACNYDKPFGVCRCTDDGKFLCQNECEVRGCPFGPYPGPSPKRPHTGEACHATAPCPYLSPAYPNTIVCTCTNGRFVCGDEPLDAGANDAPVD
jgi:hypothetical protein